MPEGPLLWYVNRSTGIVLLLLFTTTVLLGLWSTRGDAGARIPRFAVQSLHRNIGLLSVVMLLLHVGTAVLDEYVDIRWWQSVVPWRLHYEAVWLALGIVSLDLVLAVVVTSLVRERFGRRTWHAVHLSSYAVWVLSVAHGLGIGTDTGQEWAQWVYAGCAIAVVAATVLRLAASWRPTRTRSRRPAGAGATR